MCSVPSVRCPMSTRTICRYACRTKMYRNWNGICPRDINDYNIQTQAMAIVQRNALHVIVEELRSYGTAIILKTNTQIAENDYNIIIKTVIIIILLFSSLLINAKLCASIRRSPMPWNHEIVNISANLSWICQLIYLFFYCIFLRFTTYIFWLQVDAIRLLFLSSTFDDRRMHSSTNVQCSVFSSNVHNDK